MDGRYYQHVYDRGDTETANIAFFRSYINFPYIVSPNLNTIFRFWSNKVQMGFLVKPYIPIFDLGNSETIIQNLTLIVQSTDYATFTPPPITVYRLNPNDSSIFLLTNSSTI